ncbi:hypothetical protein EET67_05085 [Pseudaminobacter arsenicus]|uniref:Uncharacterized protein n=1 Tax=Borborobacter arsenicus TaxID=1851146 RepID=A0A432VA75_9HYPH|nr:hypothetical protein [Pseudaminobacter arsenicus]RUM99016.1 hypothetical protein EET67_05085 [Pseudaminobacter arsenicus]
MTALRIDTAKFKGACQAAREEFARTIEGGTWTAEDFAAQTFGEKREWYRDDYEFSHTNFRTAPLWAQVEKPEAKTAESLRAELNVAARTAQQFGATQQQIDYIVSMAVAQNDFNILSGGRLTKAEASRIIEEMEA